MLDIWEKEREWEAKNADIINESLARNKQLLDGFISYREWLMATVYTLNYTDLELE